VYGKFFDNYIYFEDEYILMDQCPLCVSGQYGAALSRDIILGRRSPVEVAQELQMSLTDVMTHVNDHQFVIDEKTGECSSPDWYLNKLASMIKQLDGWLKLSLTRDPTNDTIKTGILIVKETRGVLSQMAELQGRVDRGRSVNIQIENMNVRYQQLTNLLLQGMCDQCRGKLIELLDQQAAQLEKTKSLPVMDLTGCGP